MVAAVGVARIDALLDAGVRRFIDLTAEHEGPGPYVATLFERAAARDIRVDHRRFAIPDFGVPSPELMRAALDAVYAALGAGATPYVHCWGGVGRTGTVVGCLLREQGFDAAAALAVIDRKWQAMEKRSWHPHSPETPEQVAFIERWRGV
jgi:protein-tyrosine phosphatase